MLAAPEKKTVRDLVELYRAGMLKANPEYQRGVVWSLSQKKKLIDSALRGYPLPLIYLHHIKKTVAGMQREDFEVIDGQQRITALYEFAEGGFKLFSPNDEAAKFPAFLKSQPCPWANKDFNSLDETLKEQYLNTHLDVTKIESNDANEIRDLFVRLQSGLPLNAQETRDAWPGQYTDFILSLGGKPEVPRYPGHEFFVKCMGMNPRKDRGKTRQFAAQLAMLFLGRRANEIDFFTDINASAISEYYYSHLDFDRSSAEAGRLIQILDRLVWLLRSGGHPKLRAHDAIHLVLLVDALWDEYTRGWEARFVQALDRFTENLAKSAAVAREEPGQAGEFWDHYGQWTRVNSDRADTIARRHRFYCEKMFDYLQPLELKDPTRIYGPLEREIIFFQQKKHCAECGADLKWGDAEVHHIVEHSKGGQTKIENGAMVHKQCHPKGAAATSAFAAKIIAQRRHLSNPTNS